MQTELLADGWYWFDEIESRGPFQSEADALNDWTDSHIAPEE